MSKENVIDELTALARKLETQESREVQLTAGILLAIAGALELGTIGVLAQVVEQHTRQALNAIYAARASKK